MSVSTPFTSGNITTASISTLNPDYYYIQSLAFNSHLGGRGMVITITSPEQVIPPSHPTLPSNLPEPVVKSDLEGDLKGDVKSDLKGDILTIPSTKIISTTSSILPSNFTYLYIYYN